MNNVNKLIEWYLKTTDYKSMTTEELIFNLQRFIEGNQ